MKHSTQVSRGLQEARGHPKVHLTSREVDPTEQLQKMHSEIAKNAIRPQVCHADTEAHIVDDVHYLHGCNLIK